MLMRSLTLGAVLAAGLATAASAQPTTPLGRDFLTAARACMANVQGKLPFNPPSPALDAAGIVLADPAGEDDLKPFTDMNRSQRIFGGIKGSDYLVVASDPTQSMCRIVVENAPSIVPVTATVGPLGGDWVYQTGDPLLGFDVWVGTFMGSPKFTMRVRTPPKGNTQFGPAQYMFTFLPAPK